MRAALHSVLALAFAAAPAISTAQSETTGPAMRLAAQREAMRALAFMDGHWRGAAIADGAHRLTQTERVGSLLEGTVKLVEGRGYEADGRTSFNALGLISYDPAKRIYSMRSYAMGYAGDFPLQVRRNGFTWETPAGPATIIRYTATIEGSTWHEIGERIVGAAAPVKTFEMRLKRLGPTPWPAAGTVPTGIKPRRR